MPAANSDHASLDARVIATVHPSSILRAPDDEQAAAGDVEIRG
jgi:hypothetical protein